MLSPAFEVFSMARKGGRARKSGPRHPGGQLKQPGIDPIAPALFQRIAAEAKKKMVDERLGTEPGRLFIHQELTSAQVAAGFKLARIYQTFERLKGKRRSPASPSYGGGGDHSIAEELMSPEALRDLEDSIDEAAEKFTSLDKWIRLNFSRTLRTRLQELCVEDKYVGLITAEDRDALDRPGLFFGFTSVKHACAGEEATHRLHPDAQIKSSTTKYRPHILDRGRAPAAARSQRRGFEPGVRRAARSWPAPPFAVASQVAARSNKFRLDRILPMRQRLG
jgi:hypothetical protein